jgi:hypothetical protein
MKKEPYVTYRDGMGDKQRILGRKYTLTHSDRTGELFLTVGEEYAIDRISSIHDEVLGSFRNDCGFYYYVYVLVDDPTEDGRTYIRNHIFREELPGALIAIRKGDKGLFQAYPALDDIPIWVYFDSNEAEWEAYEYYGSFREYSNSQKK